MAIDPDALLRDAMTLPLEARATVAASLVASLEEAPAEDPDAVHEAWNQEILRRAERAVSGQDPGVPWAEARDELRRSFP